MQFRSDRTSTPMAPAGEIIYDVLRDLAFAEAKTSDTGGELLKGLAEEQDLFKIIITSRPRGSIPTSLWTSSYFVFIQSL